MAASTEISWTEVPLPDGTDIEELLNLLPKSWKLEIHKRSGKHTLSGFSFNPWIGCTKVDKECTNCYAEGIAKAYGHARWGPGQNRKVTGDVNWRGPVKWNKKAGELGIRFRVFCASMADIFDAEAPPGQLERLWNLVRATPNLDWLLLTKRPERIAEHLPADWGEGWPHAWLGTTAGHGGPKPTQRIHTLAQVPAALRWLSIEPLLGPMDVIPLEGIHWVIVGGESGSQARPMQPAWVRSIREQCIAADVPFLFKQWGTWLPDGQLTE